MYEEPVKVCEEKYLEVKYLKSKLNFCKQKLIESEEARLSLDEELVIENCTGSLGISLGNIKG